MKARPYRRYLHHIDAKLFLSWDLSLCSMLRENTPDMQHVMANTRSRPFVGSVLINLLLWSYQNFVRVPSSFKMQEAFRWMYILTYYFSVFYREIFRWEEEWRTYFYFLFCVSPHIFHDVPMFFAHLINNEISWFSYKKKVVYHILYSISYQIFKLYFACLLLFLKNHAKNQAILKLFLTSIQPQFFLQIKYVTTISSSNNCFNLLK